MVAIFLIKCVLDGVSYDGCQDHCLTMEVRFGIPERSSQQLASSCIYPIHNKQLNCGSRITNFMSEASMMFNERPCLKCDTAVIEIELQS